MPLDNFKNFAEATFTGTNVDDTLFYFSSAFSTLSTGNFNATIYDSTAYVAPHLDPNREIVRITGYTGGDSVTGVARAQESTAAAIHNTGSNTYKLLATITAKTLTDISSKMFGIEEVLFNVQAAKLPLSNPAAIEGSQDAYRLVFDDTISESAHWETTLRQNYGAGLNPQFLIPFTCKSTQTGTTVASFSVSFGRIRSGSAIDLDNLTYSNPNSGNYTLRHNATGGHPFLMTINLTQTATGISGDYVKIKIARNVDIASDVSGDLEVFNNPRLRYNIL